MAVKFLNCHLETWLTSTHQLAFTLISSNRTLQTTIYGQINTLPTGIVSSVRREFY